MSNDLRIVFMGTPDFAVASLKALLDNGQNVVGVITAPDKPAGRGQEVSQSAVKKFAMEQGLRILQPEKLKSPDFIEELKSLKADLQIVVAFRMLPELVWNMPPKGTFNLHASLLPDYRGAAPINHAIINGEKKSGVTTFFLQHEIDTGEIIFQEEVPIGDDETAGELHDKLMEVGSQLVGKTVNAIKSGDVRSVPQSSLRTGSLHEAPKIFKDFCKVDWNKDVVSLYNLIRGLSPYPAAFSEFPAAMKNLSYKIFRSNYELVTHADQPGTILTDNKKYLKVAAKNGYISILELQPAGKKRMTVEEFLRGARIQQ